MTWVLGLVLKRWPQIVALLAAAALLMWYGSHRDTIGYERRWSEDFSVELKDSMARARLADDQLWRTRISDFTMLVSSVVRENVYARYEAAAADLTAGLSQRVSDAEDRLRGCAVPTAGASDGTSSSGSQGAEGLGRLRALQQRVYDACGADGAALETLSVRPLCECPR